MGLSELLGIRVLPGTEPGEERAELLVTEECCQPWGYCSGGAMLTLEETLAGIGSTRLVDTEGAIPLGATVSANHLKAVPKGGRIRAEARILRQGKRLHVWNVDLYDDEGDIVSTARVTNAIARRRAPRQPE